VVVVVLPSSFSVFCSFGTLYMSMHTSQFPSSSLSNRSPVLIPYTFFFLLMTTIAISCFFLTTFVFLLFGTHILPFFHNNPPFLLNLKNAICMLLLFILTQLLPFLYCFEVLVFFIRFFSFLQPLVVTFSSINLT
jgi:hypothetical protein